MIFPRQDKIDYWQQPPAFRCCPIKSFLLPVKLYKQPVSGSSKTSLLNLIVLKKSWLLTLKCPHNFRGSAAGHGHGAEGPFVNYNFRMIDASRENLMDLERRRRESASSSVLNMEAREAASHSRGHPTRWLSSGSITGIKLRDPHFLQVELSWLIYGFTGNNVKEMLM